MNDIPEEQIEGATEWFRAWSKAQECEHEWHFVESFSSDYLVRKCDKCGTSRIQLEGGDE